VLEVQLRDAVLRLSVGTDPKYVAALVHELSRAS
jgi:hypothetical protein